MKIKKTGIPRTPVTKLYRSLGIRALTLVLMHLINITQAGATYTVDHQSNETPPPDVGGSIGGVNIGGPAGPIANLGGGAGSISTNFGDSRVISGTSVAAPFPAASPVPALVSMLGDNTVARDIAGNLMTHADAPGITPFLTALQKLESPVQVAKALEKTTDTSVQIAAQHHQALTDFGCLFAAFAMHHLSPQLLVNHCPDAQSERVSFDKGAQTQLRQLAHQSIHQTPSDSIIAGVAAPADDLHVHLDRGSVWFQMRGTHSDVTAYQASQGASIHTVAPEMGLSYNVSSALRVGLFGGPQRIKMRLFDHSAHRHAQGYGLGAQFSYNPDRQTYLDGALQYGSHHARGMRTIEVTKDAQSLFSAQMHHKARRQTYTAGLEAGRVWCLPFGFSFRPYMGAGLSYHQDGAYREVSHNQDGMTLSVSSHQSRYFQGRTGVHFEKVGARAQGQYSTFLDIGYTHTRQLGRSRAPGVSFLDTPLERVTGRTTTDTLKIGLGGTALWQHGVYTSATAEFGVTGPIRSQAVMLRLGKRI